MWGACLPSLVLPSQLDRLEHESPDSSGSKSRTERYLQPVPSHRLSDCPSEFRSRLATESAGTATSGGAVSNLVLAFFLSVLGRIQTSWLHAAIFE
jgi:hypothetical protein